MNLKKLLVISLALPLVCQASNSTGLSVQEIAKKERTMRHKCRDEGAIIARAMYDHHHKIVPQQFPIAPKEADVKNADEARTAYEEGYDKLANAHLKAMTDVVSATIQENEKLEREAKGEEALRTGKLKLAAKVAAHYAYSVRMNQIHRPLLEEICDKDFTLFNKASAEYRRAAYQVTRLPKDLSDLVLQIQATDPKKDDDQFFKTQWVCRFARPAPYDYVYVEAEPLTLSWSFQSDKRYAGHSNAILERTLTLGNVLLHLKPVSGVFDLVAEYWDEDQSTALAYVANNALPRELQEVNAVSHMIETFIDTNAEDSNSQGNWFATIDKWLAIKPEAGFHQYAKGYNNRGTFNTLQPSRHSFYSAPWCTTSKE